MASNVQVRKKDAARDTQSVLNQKLLVPADVEQQSEHMREELGQARE